MTRNSTHKIKRTTRPPKVNRDGPQDGFEYSTSDKVYRLALLGLRDVDIAVVLDITHTTLDRWKRNHPELKEALIKGRKQADAVIAEALYSRAKGYTHPDVHILTNRITDYDENTGKPTHSYNEALIVPITKHYPPDTKAATFWLQNRTRDQENPWSNRFEITGKDGVDLNLANLNLEDFTNNELEILKKLSKKLNVKADAE